MEDKRKKLLQRIYKVYRIVIYKENLEEKASLRLTPLNLILFFAILSAIGFIFTWLLIAFTPIKETIPALNEAAVGEGAADVYRLQRRTDSLENALKASEAEAENLKRILKGEARLDVGDVEDVRDVKDVKIEDGVIEQRCSRAGEGFSPAVAALYSPGLSARGNCGAEDSRAAYPGLKARGYKNAATAGLKPSPAHQNNSIYHYASLTSPKSSTSSTSRLLPPVRGYISARYAPARDHYALDLVTSPNAPVKAVADGVVIFSEWSSTTGHVIVLQHPDNLLSVYKHNSVLLKKTQYLCKSRRSHRPRRQ